MISTINLSNYDKALLDGDHGKAAQSAMKIILRIAEIQKAEELIDISHVHIGGSLYTGEYSLKVIEKIQENGGKVVVPTTINAISIDRKRWKEQKINPTFARNADRLATAFEKMGAKPIFSCTPYIFPDGPIYGDDIVWAESNAIAYSNSVIGARTNRHGDFFDICAAITGRAPKSGLHIKENRYGKIQLNVTNIDESLIDTSFYTVLGYAVGKKSTKGIPVVKGLKKQPSLENLKAFSAAVSTSGPVGLYHLIGITPEAKDEEEAFGGKKPEFVHDITKKYLKQVWEELSTGNNNHINMIVLGSPHYTLKEIEELTNLVEGKKKLKATDFLITTSTYVYKQAEAAGYVNIIKEFGARFSTDICLCMLNEQMLSDEVDIVMTNSGKFAHYGPGLINKNVQFNTTKKCVDAAVYGEISKELPEWLL